MRPSSPTAARTCPSARRFWRIFWILSGLRGVADSLMDGDGLARVPSFLLRRSLIGPKDQQKSAERNVAGSRLPTRSEHVAANCCRPALIATGSVARPAVRGRRLRGLGLFPESDKTSLCPFDGRQHSADSQVVPFCTDSCASSPTPGSRGHPSSDALLRRHHWVIA
ncbi:hypothetical protein OH77DRAFT_252023 [Trametes cingulata]|nr:hypothetical protein OH77DRAFT_252023 [Trametes cingulata]